MNTTRPSSWCSCALVILVVLAVFGVDDIQARRKKVWGACFLPKVIGRCRASLPRFYFDRSRRACKKFGYGGCGGNENNFKTMALCQKRCGHDNTSVATTINPECRHPLRTGPCKAAFTKYYFDRVSGQCKTFVYGGCKGNKNRFDTLVQCRGRCILN